MTKIEDGVTVTLANGNEAHLKGAAELISKGTGGDAKFTWHPVNLTWANWKAKLGDDIENYPTHSGTLLRTERGVFGCGIIGTFFAGSKRDDGSVDRTGATFDERLDAGADIILEYADPDYGNWGCHRDATTGAIVCKCPVTY